MCICLFVCRFSHRPPKRSWSRLHASAQTRCAKSGALPRCAAINTLTKAEFVALHLTPGQTVALWLCFFNSEVREFSVEFFKPADVKTQCANCLHVNREPSVLAMGS